ncbi:phosphotransferase enzyme family protein [Modestobacter marinus]|uniref:phosphotransferase enzyme family protein n=1 Tax=Modestobacter marinus TaxID=477641 RepID=UPI001C98C6E6|nr:phosphotransferase [Modestobacter marinus]
MTAATAPLLDRSGEPLPLPELADLWPLGGWQSVDRVLGGKNEHLRLVTGDGVHYLRRSPRTKSEEELVAQLELMRLLRSRGFPAPEVVPTRAGADHVQVQGRWWVVTRGIAGTPFDDGSRAHLRALGQVLGRYHRLVADLPAVMAEPPALAELRLRAARPDVDPALQARAVDVVGRLTALLPELPRVVVHGGARRGSLLFDGERVVGVLDFDSAHADVRVLDLAVAVHDVGKVYTRLGDEDHKVALDLDRVTAVLAAYRAEVRTAPAEAEALPLLAEAKRLKRALGRINRARAGEQLSDNDHAKIRLEDNRLLWLDGHREELVAACRRALA